MNALRWILALPTALVGAWIVWLIASWLMNSQIIHDAGGNPEAIENPDGSIFKALMLYYIPSVAAGIALIQIGWQVPPIKSTATLAAVASIGSAIAAILIFSSFLVSEYLRLTSTIPFAIGIALGTILAHQELRVLERERIQDRYERD